MIGIDLVYIPRITRLMTRYGERFLKRWFTGGEIDYIVSKAYSPKTVAGIFASKEAVAKARGTGIGEVGFRDIEVFHNPLHARSCGEIYQLSISHDGDYAVAVALHIKEETYEHR
ncbi:holo-ACP synthase [Peptoniphilus equinus]|uniref:Holo-[acyl-carrier-protein] synthase n=1 Tax=Peptoniphilus equinus TaxID=3016343 RepID=A0ABY7QWI2_9FIRM|nr:holo-ACP synthase [Peptoniphilus equinus]WBW50459.1 holo-ACP synthase [Peptoniphilus equinus]